MAVTVTYAYPVAGVTPPTAAQAKKCNTITATVAIGADTDTSFVMTHNWGLSTAQLAFNFPLVTITPNVVGTAVCTIAAVLTNSNIVTFSKGNVAGSAGTYIVVLQRPCSLAA